MAGDDDDRQQEWGEHAPTQRGTEARAAEFVEALSVESVTAPHDLPGYDAGYAVGHEEGYRAGLTAGRAEVRAVDWAAGKEATLVTLERWLREANVPGELEIVSQVRKATKRQA